MKFINWAQRCTFIPLTTPQAAVLNDWRPAPIWAKLVSGDPVCTAQIFFTNTELPPQDSRTGRCAAPWGCTSCLMALCRIMLLFQFHICGDFDTVVALSLCMAPEYSVCVQLVLNLYATGNKGSIQFIGKS